MHIPSIPLSLYIHFPWCIKKCPYCDFNSHAINDSIPENEYIACLLANLEQQLPWIQNREIISIFMGGGTPSLISAQSIDTLLERLRKKLSFAQDIEITLEANPGAMERQRFKDYRQAGVNRISLGIQSFNPEHLKILGRIHSRTDAVQAIDTVQAAGFDNYNLDLMFGLPQQSVAQGLADLEQALSFQAPHLSWYELTIEPNTLFWSKPPELPKEAHIIDLHEQGQARLAAAGYEQYEVSAYSRQRPCRHNLNYWQFGDYLAIGAGSHGKLTTPEGLLRLQHYKSPKQFLDITKPFVLEKRIVASDQIAFEFMLNAMRLKAGFDLSLFTARTGLTRDTISPQLKQGVAQGYLIWQDDHIKPTLKGYQFLNDIIGFFLENDGH